MSIFEIIEMTVNECQFLLGWLIDKSWTFSSHHINEFFGVFSVHLVFLSIISLALVRVLPVISITLLRDCCPRNTWTRLLETLKSSAINSSTASLALPSIGGALTRILR